MVTAPSGRPVVLLLLQKEAARNPVVRMYAAALAPIANVVVACTDPEAATHALPHATCVSIAGSGLVARARTTVAALRRRRERPAIATAVGGREPGPRQDGREVQPSRPSWRRMRTDVGATLSSAESLRRLPRPTLILAIDGDVLLTARALSTWWRVPYIYVMYEIYPNQYTTLPPEEVHHLAMVEACGVRGAAHLLVMDPTWGTLLARRYGVPRSRTSVVRICPPVPARRARPVIDGPCRFYYHGGYTADRGLEQLVVSMAGVRGGELHMRGLGGLEPELRRLAARPEIQGKVVFHDPLPLAQLADAAADFDVGISISCAETGNGRFLMGFKTMENLSAGLALACTNSRALTAFVETHGVGLTFESCRSASIAAAFQSCVDAPDRVAAWKVASRAAAEREYNNTVQERRLREVLQPWIHAEARRR